MAVLSYTIEGNHSHLLPIPTFSSQSIVYCQRHLILSLFVWTCVWACARSLPAQERSSLFDDSIAPLLEQNCISCHNAEKKEGGLALDTQAALWAGGDSGPVIDADKPENSSLLLAVLPDGNDRPAMPKGRPALSHKQTERLREWLKQKSPWTTDRRLAAHEQPSERWWSLEPLTDHTPPTVAGASRNANVIDAFIHQKIAEQNLTPVSRATRRELIRRVTIDLTGLSPTFDEINSFAHDDRPDAYERLVDRLLAAPAYGERWARHWLDVVHYGETHGYDKDKLRLNAWPYRDYVIHAFNSDKPYDQFVQEQIAGDVLWPDQPEAIEAVGFLAAGPWDFIGHAEVPESKLDGRIARHLDRDDMVQNTFLTFQSLTIGCAQCHQHKFDPISQAEYYGLQAVFAALDRTDRKYYRDPKLQAKFAELLAAQRSLERDEAQVRSAITKSGGEELANIEQLIAAARSATPKYPPEHGYHSSIETKPDVTKWVQVDLGKSQAIAEVQWVACHDDFAGIGEGFGAPVRWKIEASDDPAFSQSNILWDHTASNHDKPGVAIQSRKLDKPQARYVRFTATQLAMRKDDYILALAELRVLDSSGANIALGRPVSSLDSIEAPIRWARSNLVDDKYPRAADAQGKQLAELQAERQAILSRLVPQATLDRQKQLADQVAEIKSQLAKLPAPSVTYVATIHFGQGAFAGTGPGGGRPREVQVLPRGDVSRQGPPALPCSVNCLSELDAKLAPLDSSDAERRAALARWLSDRRNPLTWRSIVNRIWSYHFHRGIVESPNDFGRMGALPSHPELLDRLATDLREHQSLKHLQRQIVLSETYQRSSQANATLTEADPNNRLLTHSPRRRLEAEAVRDSMLSVAGLLRREMGGPSYQDFVIEHPEHSPHYEYAKHDPRDPATMRRSVYRFIARSQTQPLMTSLDCADPSMQVDVRSESNSPTQALSLLNNAFTLMAAEEWADRANKTNRGDRQQLITQMFANAIGRLPSSDEVQMLIALDAEHGTTSVARVIFNLNEFLYVD